MIFPPCPLVKVYTVDVILVLKYGDMPAPATVFTGVWQLMWGPSKSEIRNHKQTP